MFPSCSYFLYKGTQSETSVKGQKRNKKKKEKRRAAEEDEEELPLRVEWREEDSLKRILFPPVIQSWTRPGQLLSRWTDNFLGWFRGFRTGKRGKGARRSRVTITELCTPGWLQRHEFYRRLENTMATR